MTLDDIANEAGLNKNQISRFTLHFLHLRHKFFERIIFDKNDLKTILDIINKVVLGKGSKSSSQIK